MPTVTLPPGASTPRFVEGTRTPTAQRAERWHPRGIASAPGNGGLAVVARRAAKGAGS